MYGAAGAVAGVLARFLVGGGVGDDQNLGSALAGGRLDGLWAFFFLKGGVFFIVYFLTSFPQMERRHDRALLVCAFFSLVDALL